MRFPNAVIPQKAWSAPAQKLLQYIPSPNVAATIFDLGSDEKLRDDKGAMRWTPIQASARFQPTITPTITLSITVSGVTGGANVPGFNALNLGRAQLITIGDTKVLGPRTVNEIISPLSAMRTRWHAAGTVGTNWYRKLHHGFRSTEHLPQRPSIVGVENVNFSDFTIGSTVTGLIQKDNTIELRDNFSRLAGAHTLKAGGQLMLSQVNWRRTCSRMGPSISSARKPGSISRIF